MSVEAAARCNVFVPLLAEDAFLPTVGCQIVPNMLRVSGEGDECMHDMRRRWQRRRLPTSCLSSCALRRTPQPRRTSMRLLPSPRRRSYPAPHAVQPLPLSLQLMRVRMMRRLLWEQMSRTPSWMVKRNPPCPACVCCATVTAFLRSLCMILRNTLLPKRMPGTLLPVHLQVLSSSARFATLALPCLHRACAYPGRDTRSY